MKKLKYLLILLLPFSILACEGLFPNGDDSLSDDDIILGLKTALRFGTDTSVSTLGKNDGYWMDAAVKIALPEEAQMIYDNANNTYLQQLGVTAFIREKIDTVRLRINRSAEMSAAVDSTKIIFVDAITGMTVENGLDILNGVNPISKSTDFDSIAATHYFQHKTYNPLKTLFRPIVNFVLNIDLAGGYSTNDIWYETRGAYNNALSQSILGITVASLTGYQKVNTELDDYVTGKALDGLFYKIGEEEKQIRRDPFKWASEIIQKVFGSIWKALTS